MTHVSVQTANFDVGLELARLEALGGGAVASFTGIVRGDEGLVAMTLEQYPGMTEKALGAIAAEAAGRWTLRGITIIHRFGRLPVGDRIVLVGTASSHRAAAFEACAFIMDWLKTDAPFWKHEEQADGTGRWVEARATDDAARARWEGDQ